MATKASLGIATLGMVTSLYFKIKIIYKKESAKEWEKYSKWIYIGMGAIIVINLAVVIYYTVIFAKNYETYIVGEKLIPLHNNFYDWL